MDSNTFLLLFGTITALGAGCFTYLLNKIAALEKQNLKKDIHIQKLENLINGFLTSFLVLNSQSNLPIDSKILALVLETKTKLEKIQDIQNQND